MNRYAAIIDACVLGGGLKRNIILSLAEAQSVLCFAKTAEGITDIVQGNNHPALKGWRGEMNLGTLFAAGVLG